MGYSLNAKKCWYCANLGGCTTAQKPCSDFALYRYYDIPEYSIKRVAKLCGFAERTIYRWLKVSVPYALWEIHRYSGLKLKYVEQENGRHKFIKS